jgi:hypothetical protein
MQVRSRLDGELFVARLEMCRVAGRRPRFLLFVQDSNGEQRSLSRIAAVVGLELVTWSSRELAALTLAGFLLPRSGAKGHSLWRLAGILRNVRQKETQETARSPHPMPADSKGKRAAGRRGDGETSNRRLQHGKDSTLSQLRASRNKLLAKNAAQLV